MKQNADEHNIPPKRLQQRAIHQKEKVGEKARIVKVIPKEEPT